MHALPHYRPIFDFIAGLGLPIAETALPEDTFLPGIAIRDGGLLVDPSRLRWPADLLHEAGHLAVLPPALRAQAQDDLPGQGSDAHTRADQAHAEAQHAGEQEALAWAWAAAMHLGLPPQALIHEGGYGGKSQALLQMYAFGIYPGLRGLCALGMTSAPGFETPGFNPPEFELPGGDPPLVVTSPVPGAHATSADAPPIHYPQMHRWLRA